MDHEEAEDGNLTVSIEQLTDLFKSVKTSPSKTVMPKDLPSFLAWENEYALDWMTRYEQIGVANQ